MQASELLKMALSQTSEIKFGEIMDRFPRVLREGIASDPEARAEHEQVMAQIAKGLGIRA